MELYSAHEGRSPEIGAKLLASGEQAGQSVAEMAQRDLDTALQLLANRAQYITGASGAAIALRRDGKNDMLCRASTGSNAPELGALLSTEVGLSGESVRTRQMLRCDDAERDVRVNRDVCRQLGIASVVVMPVVNDDEVLGVFELFSGKANAFGARDVSAVQRLSEMVETAVRLAHATATLPERLKMGEAPAIEIEVDGGEEGAAPAEGKPVVAVFVEERIAEEKVASEIPTLSQRTRKDGPPAAVEIPGAPAHDAASAVVSTVEEPHASSKKKLYWSAAATSASDEGKVVEPDQSHVPPVLRSLRKCEACGFPISAGRVLCVECEEKKWRGQVKVPKMVGPRPAAIPSPFAAKTGPAAAAKSEVRAFAAAAQSAGVNVRDVGPGVGATPKIAAPASREKESKEVAQSIVATTQAAQSAAIPELVNPAIPVANAEFVLSAGLQPSQSWLSANKYVIGVLLAVGGGVAAIFLLR